MSRPHDPFEQRLSAAMRDRPLPAAAPDLAERAMRLAAQANPVEQLLSALARTARWRRLCNLAACLLLALVFAAAWNALSDGQAVDDVAIDLPPAGEAIEPESAEWADSADDLAPAGALVLAGCGAFIGMEMALGRRSSYALHPA